MKRSAASSNLLLAGLAMSFVVSAELPYFDPDQTPYRTPRAGDGFRTDILGEPVTVQPQDWSAVNAWMAGMQINPGAPSDHDLQPAMALYFWRNRQNQDLLRAHVSVFYNDVFWFTKPEDWGGYNLGFTFNSYTPPGPWNEIYDGRKDRAGEMYWGYLRPGFALGRHEPLATGRPDNFWLAEWIIEPGYIYFGRSDQPGDTALPRSGFELRNRLLLHFDGLERNLLALAHEGFVGGTEWVYGHRFNWAEWGNRAALQGGDNDDYYYVTGHALHASGVPGVASDRHRLLASLHAGIGANLDRFNAPRVGGGPNPMGMEVATGYPVLPGATLWEFFPRGYSIAQLEYRYELTWFSYASLHGSLGYLDVLRQERGSDRFFYDHRFTQSIGAKLTTGFVGNTLLTLDYNRNFGLVRDNQYGSDEIMVWVAGQF